MTWEELKEEVKKMGYKEHQDIEAVGYGNGIIIDGFCNGRNYFDERGNCCLHGLNPDQMLAIIKALQ